MSIIGVLVRNETIKASRRLAFWVTLIVYALMCSLMSTAMLDNTRTLGAPMLPEWWARTLDDAIEMGFVFSSAITTLLISSEFAWRTARQNVIDGLSKDQWFSGKLLSVFLLVVPIVAIGLLIIGSFGAVATDWSRPDVQWFRTSDLQFFAGFVIAVLGFCSIGFFFAMAVRNPGPALGAFFLYTFFIERIIPRLAEALHDGWGRMGAYTPTSVFASFASPGRWYGSEQPIAVPNDRLVILAAVYMAVLVLASFVIFRKRDL